MGRASRCWRGPRWRLFESDDPATLEQAVWLMCPDLRPTGELFDAIADAWERYRHIKDMPWD